MSAPASDEAWIAEAMARGEAATAGPWEVSFYQEEHYVAALLIPPHAGGLMKIVVDGRQQFTNPEPDADFIAHARTDLPRALRELTEARARIAALTEALANAKLDRAGLVYALALHALYPCGYNASDEGLRRDWTAAKKLVEDAAANFRAALSQPAPGSGEEG